MKNLIVCMAMIGLLTNSAISCDWSTIKKQDSEYVYSADCHKEVGKLVGKVEKLERANLERQKEAESLNKAIELKDLALNKADERIMNWRNETYNQHERLLRQEKLAKYNDWLYFGGGVGLTILSVWASGQLRK